jgi:tetratricopeptide (TPR) repeat protein
VRGETEYAVPPLAESEAVELFTARSRLPADATITELCRRLDDLPLAIELAAARAAVLTPAQILERLAKRLDLLKGGRDAETRQATLRATIEWSHELLSADERSLFARLSIFRGGWTLEAAEQIREADLDVLQSLVDKSLVRRTGERFVMLETIREFAAERLAASGEADEIGRRHAEWFLALAAQAHPQIARDPQRWLPRLDAEHDNFRAAIDGATEAGDAELVTRLCGELWPFWYLADHAAEARRRLDAALSHYDEPDAVRAKALNGAMAMALEMGDPGGARPLAQEAVAIHERLGDPWSLANSRFLLAQVSATEGDWPTGRDMLEESVRAFVELGDSHFSMIARRTLAWMYEELGDTDRYRALTEENYREARATGNKRVEARAQASLAGFVVEEGRVAEGLAMYQSSLRLDREVGDHGGSRIDLYDIAEALSVAGESESAALILAGTEAWRNRSGVALESWLERITRATLERLHADLDDDEFAAAWHRGAAMTEDEVAEFALGASVEAERPASV